MKKIIKFFKNISKLIYIKDASPSKDKKMTLIKFLDYEAYWQGVSHTTIKLSLTLLILTLLASFPTVAHAKQPDQEKVHHEH